MECVGAILAPFVLMEVAPTYHQRVLGPQLEYPIIKILVRMRRSNSMKTHDEDLRRNITQTQCKFICGTQPLEMV